MTTLTGSDIDWIAGAKLLGERIPLSQMDASVVAELSTVASSTEWVSVACSGGVDSLSVLLLVWVHFPRLRERLLVLGFDHRTRPECAAEMRFVETVSLALGVRFIGGIREDQVDADNTSEAALRQQRLAFFSREMSGHSCRVLVQGHQADDVAETMLMRLARGSGTAGLAAPRPVQHFEDGRLFLRPLLSVKKTTLIDAMLQCGLPWCEDASNGKGDYLRNRVRHNVIPAWEQAQGAMISQGVLRSRRLLEEDDTALETWLAQLWPQMVETGMLTRYDWRPLIGLPQALHRRALWNVLQMASLGESMGAQAVDNIVDSLAAGIAGRWSVGLSYLIFDGIELKIDPCCTRDTEGWVGSLFSGMKLFWPSGGMLEVKEVIVIPTHLASIMQGNFSPRTDVYLNPDSITSGLNVRTWQQGDAYQALGAPGSRKLSDVFIDKKINAAERRELPVVCDNKGILWVPGLPPADRCRLQSSAEKALQLTWAKAPLTSFVLENESVSE
ncbi:MAG: tRNA lysidine(34) synthetase TilS [Puniceicoccales bacterium]|jgi:tRNA(Ile)-lysidine synthase|nr:tRNA lysidine(34) synthetase TilS [Puniceicoccales bacterium]